ncbi:MAG: RidA family protein [Bacteroidota bacterium]
MQRTNVSTGAEWENKVGYSRATRIGNQIEVSGTVAIEDGKPAYIDDAYGQTKCILNIIEKSVKKLGAELSDVIRTRIYVTDISKWNEVGKAHGEYFTNIKPATSMVEVSNLIKPEFLVEIEATAMTNP